MFPSLSRIALLFISFKLVFSQELRMVASETNWSIFNPKNKDKCFVASQSIKDEAFRNGRIKSGDYVLLMAFGAGLTWATSLIKWQ